MSSTPGATPVRTFSQVKGLNRATCATIRRLESGPFWPGYVADALAAYQRFLRKPGRVLYPPVTDCPCCDPVDARDMLERVLRMLPRGGGRDLRRLVAELDLVFERRTLPDPWLSGLGQPFGKGAWWRNRLRSP